jgi:hypothetical protein
MKLKNESSLPDILANHLIGEGKLILVMINLDPDKRSKIEEVSSTIYLMAGARGMLSDCDQVKSRTTQ